MQLKRYEAQTINEALKKIKTELGKEAVIFSSKTFVQKNRPGRKYVEVMAAVDRDCNVPGDTGFENDPANNRASYMPIFPKYLKNLLLSGFNRDISWCLIGESNAEFNREGNSLSYENILFRKIADHMPVEGPIIVNSKKKKVVAMIGPTGVGKTTTLAKIAARYSIMPGIRVKILTMDTYRIAAAEQLRIYGKIMGIPVYVVTCQEELEKELRTGDDVNLTLIDTAGRNYRDNDQIMELNRWLNKYDEIESHLLLSATTSEDVLRSTLLCFNNSRVDRVIITKVDESVTIGHLYNIIVSLKNSVSYITTGQRVPEDIRPATAQILSGLFLNGFSKSVSANS